MDKVGKDTLETMEKSKWYNDWLLALLSKEVRGDILEIGSGIGNFTLKLSKLGHVWASDINPDYLRILNKIRKHNIHSGKCNIETGSYYFDTKKFDSIVCLNVLEHIENDSKALKNMFKLLKSGGKLCLLVPAHELLYSNFDNSLGHFRRYSKSNLNEKLLATGFCNIKIRYLNWFGSLGWFLIMKLGNSSKIPDSKLKIFDKLASLLLLPEKYIKLPFGLSVYAVCEKC